MAYMCHTRGIDLAYLWQGQWHGKWRRDPPRDSGLQCFQLCDLELKGVCAEGQVFFIAAPGALPLLPQSSGSAGPNEHGHRWRVGTPRCAKGKGCTCAHSLSELRVPSFFFVFLAIGRRSLHGCRILEGPPRPTRGSRAPTMAHRMDMPWRIGEVHVWKCMCRRRHGFSIINAGADGPCLRITKARADGTHMGCRLSGTTA